MKSPQVSPAEGATSANGASAGTQALPFAPLPLRARSVLEIFDVAIRVFRRYFKVLMGWAGFVAVVSGVSGGLTSGAAGATSTLNPNVLIGRVASTISLAGFLSLLLWPLAIGAVACCLAAAVRGQNVSFGQCWQFTKPRYWAILGSCILAGILGFVVAMVTMIAFAFVAAIGGASLRALPGAALWIAGTIFFLVVLIVPTTLISLLGTWFTMVPIVVCMEDDKRNSSSLGRATDLMKGHGRRTLSLGFVLGLATLLFWAIGQATIYLLSMLPHLMGLAQGTNGDEFDWATALISSVTSALMTSFTTPFSFLVVALFYLDLRVRKEALDLEWAAHASAPAASETPKIASDQPSFANREMAPNFNSYGAPDAATTMPQTVPPTVSASSPISSDAVSASFSNTSDAATTTGAFPNAGPDASQNLTVRLPPEDPTAPLAPPSIVESVFGQSPVAQNTKAPLPSVTSPSVTSPAATAPTFTTPTFTAPIAESPTFPVSDALTQVLPSQVQAEMSTDSSSVYDPDFSASSDAAPDAPSLQTNEMAPDMSTHAAPDAHKCPLCGVEYPATQSFCMQCGARLSAPNTAL